MTQPTEDNAASPVNKSRRNFLIYTGAAAALAVTAGAASQENQQIKGVPSDGFPVPLDEKVLKPFDQRNLIFSYAVSRKLQQQYPERDKAFAQRIGLNYSIRDSVKSLIMHSKPVPTMWNNDAPGYTQKDWALTWAVTHPLEEGLGPRSKFGVPNVGVMHWEQKNLAPVKWNFKDGKEAAQNIKRAGKLFGATQVGITQNDPRWNYDPIFNPLTNETFSWEKDVPFKPKTVIVMLVEMEYEAIRTGASPLAASAAGTGYTQMAVMAGQMADFLRRLGYKAIASHNDMANSVAYGIAAGLGEGARNGMLISPKVGPRARLMKVFTDLDVVEYDRAKNYGIMEFCERCKLCAEACPSNAISMDDKPSFRPTYDGWDDPDYAWHSQNGIRKFYSDAKKCFKFWGDNGKGCAICIKTCPWNKPDFWHHRLVHSTNAVVPGAIHTIMREADSLFGYGTMPLEKAADKFWNDKKKLNT